MQFPRASKPNRHEKATSSSLSEECHLSHTGRSFRLVSYRRPSRPRLYNPLARRSALRAAEQFSLSPSPGLRILLDPSLKTTGPHSTIFGSWETLREETRLQMDAATLLRQPTANPPPAKSSKVWKAVRVCLSGAKEWHECQKVWPDCGTLRPTPTLRPIRYTQPKQTSTAPTHQRRRSNQRRSPPVYKSAPQALRDRTHLGVETPRQRPGGNAR